MSVSEKKPLEPSEGDKSNTYLREHAKFTKNVIRNTVTRTSIFILIIIFSGFWSPDLFHAKSGSCKTCD